MVDIQTGTILLAVATFMGALVGSLTQYYLNRRNEEKKERNLRLALQSEIEQIREELETASDLSEQAGNLGAEEPMFAPMFALAPDSLFPTVVFEGNTDKIGMLSEEEMDCIISFYSAVLSLKGFLSMFSEEEVIKRRENIPIKKFIRTIEERSDDLHSQANDTIELIDRNL